MCYVSRLWVLGAFIFDQPGIGIFALRGCGLLWIVAIQGLTNKHLSVQFLATLLLGYTLVKALEQHDISPLLLLFWAIARIHGSCTQPFLLFLALSLLCFGP